MIGRFHIATKNINLLSSLQDSITCINKVHLSKLLNLHENNVINPSDYRNLIYYLSQAPDKLRLNELNTLVKGMLYTKYKPDTYFFDKIMSNLSRNYQENPLLSVDTFYYLLLLNHEDVLSDECVEFLDNFRISADVYVQLKLLKVFYAIQFYHSHIQESYTPEIENFVKYLKLISPKLKLKCGIKEESKEIKQVKSTMDSLNLEYFSAVTGHIYSPIILKNTNMAIEMRYERDKYLESEDSLPTIQLKQLIMRDLGWRVRFIPFERWKHNSTDFERRKYLSKFVSEFYVETQFTENPPWVINIKTTSHIKK